MGEITAFPNGLSSFGGVQLPTFPIGQQSQVIWADAVNGNDGMDGSSPQAAVQTVARGYSLLRSGFFDTLILIGLGSAFALTADLVWSKNNTNLVGLTTPALLSQRARITSGSSNALSPMVTFSGFATSVINTQFANFGNSATASPIAVLNSGQRNYFKNVQFAGGGNATTRGGTAMRSLVISGNGAGNGENLFEDCVIGLDTINTTGASYELELNQATPRNIFRRCKLIKQTGTGGAGGGFVTCPTGGLDRFTIFNDCEFINYAIGGVALTTGFNLAATGGYVIINRCLSVGMTGWTGGAKANFISENQPSNTTVGIGLEPST